MEDPLLEFSHKFEERVISVSTKLAEIEHLYTKMGLVPCNDVELGRIVRRSDDICLSWVMHAMMFPNQIDRSYVYLNVFYNVGDLGILIIEMDATNGWSARFDRDGDMTVGEPWPDGLSTLMLRLSEQYDIPGLGVARVGLEALKSRATDSKKLNEVAAMEILVALGKHFAQNDPSP